MSPTQVWLPQPGERIGRYQILAPLAEGGMAAVYVAQLESMAGVERRFAVKIPLPRMRQEPDALSMFLDEARIAARVVHQNVAQVFELGEHNGTPYIVMELIEGHSLSALAARAATRGGIERGLFLRVVADAARGLHAAHEAKTAAGAPLAIVHRDVSPQNIHVAYDGAVKIVDFGIARAHGRLTKTESGQIKGKYRYVAPEQVNALPVDRRADVWALGVILWEQLSGQTLFRNEEEAATLWNILNKTVPPLRSIVPDVSEALEAITRGCLERDVDRRTADAASVANALDPLAASNAALAAAMLRLFDGEKAAQAQPRVSLPAVPVAIARPRRWWIGGVAALAALLAVMAWKLAPRGSPPAQPSHAPVAHASPPPAPAEPAIVPAEVTTAPAEPPAIRHHGRARPRANEATPTAAPPPNPLLDNPYH